PSGSVHLSCFSLPTTLMPLPFLRYSPQTSGEARPRGDLEEGDFFLRLLVLFEKAVGRHGELAHRRPLGGVGKLSILHAAGSLRRVTNAGIGGNDIDRLLCIGRP